MRTYRPLRPSLLNELVATAVRSAVSADHVLDVGQEATRISTETGFTVRTVAGELVAAGVKARAAIALPSMDELDPFTSLLEERRQSRIVWRSYEPSLAKRSLAKT
jgi:hypothetical protein